MELTKEFVENCNKPTILREFLLQAMDQVEHLEKDNEKLLGTIRGAYSEKPWTQLLNTVNVLVDTGNLDISDDELESIHQLIASASVLQIKVIGKREIKKFKDSCTTEYKKLKNRLGRCIQYIEPDLMKEVGKEKYLSVQPKVYVTGIDIYQIRVEPIVILHVASLLEDNSIFEFTYNFSLNDFRRGKVVLREVDYPKNKIVEKLAERAGTTPDKYHTSGLRVRSGPVPAEFINY